MNEPMAGASVSGPLEHSVLKIDLDGGHMEGVSVLEPLEHSVLDISLDGGPMEGESDLEPLEHSVLDVNLDSRLMQGELDSRPLEHSVPDHAPIGGAVPFVKLSVLDPLEHSGLINSDDVIPKSVPLEPLENSVPEAPQSRGDGLVSDVDTQVQLSPVCLPRVASDTQVVDVPLLDDRPQATRSRRLEKQLLWVLLVRRHPCFSRAGRMMWRSS